MLHGHMATTRAPVFLILDRIKGFVPTYILITRMLEGLPEI
jgi:hypothetical protein